MHWAYSLQKILRINLTKRFVSFPGDIPLGVFVPSVGPLVKHKKAIERVQKLALKVIT